MTATKIMDLRKDLMELEEKRDEALERGEFVNVLDIEAEMDEVVWAIQRGGRDD